MRRVTIKYHLFACDYPPLVKLVDRYNKEYIGYLVHDAYDNKGYAILPIDVNERIKHFKASHIKEIRCFKNNCKWSDITLKNPEKLFDFYRKNNDLEEEL